MQKITPFLWFNEEAEEAANLYTSIFKNGKIGDIARYPEGAPGPAGKVMTVNFEIAGQAFTALNGGPEFSFTPAISFFVYCQTQQELDTLWEKLAQGGQVLMELDKYPFSERFGWLNDRYGVSWQLALDGRPQQITPYFLFVGEQCGRAEEAMQFYASQFANSSIAELVRYPAGTGEVEGNVMHGRFLLNGQEFMAMDSSAEHKFTFTEAISFYVDCETQEEVDRFWVNLSAGGEEGPCGWLKDKFGVSWQIVPRILTVLMSDPDPQKASRVTQAMLKMGKIEISKLQEAYEHA